MMCEEMIFNTGFLRFENYLQEKSICSRTHRKWKENILYRRN